MGIVTEDVARVRAATDFAAVVGEQVALRRVGNRLVGLCPFHTEKTGSFYVNSSEGLYHCFGCQASGDAITFVRETQHLDFVEAVEWLASRAGVTVRYDDARTNKDQRRRGVLLDALERAVDWYHERLLTEPDAGTARSYLRERGYGGDTVRQFKLGWAPDDWDTLCRALQLTPDVLVDTGLGFVNKAGRQQDSFRGRVMFPIFDVAGHAVAFGGRILPGGQGPKYKNSQETAVYAKRRTLYGLNWAKSDVVTAGEVVVCEGYTDVIGLFRAGVPRAVATCGTALADEHFRILKNFARRVVLAYDADAAGQGAADRFYTWEQRFDLDIAVVQLPAGSDPGELADKDPEALRQAVSDAKPFLAFRVDRILDGADLRTAESRARTAEQALEVVAEHPSDFVRDAYVMSVADRCRLAPAQLRARLDDLRRSGRRMPMRVPSGRAPRGHDHGDEGDPGPSPPGEGSSGEGVRPDAWSGPSETMGDGAEQPAAEVGALRLAVHRPEVVAPYLEEPLFVGSVTRAAFRALVEADTLHDAIDDAPSDVAALLRRVAVEDDDTDADDIIALLVRRATQRALTELEAQARASQTVINLTWPKTRMEDLERGETRVEAAQQLVAWLLRTAEGEGA